MVCRDSNYTVKIIIEACKLPQYNVGVVDRSYPVCGDVPEELVGQSMAGCTHSVLNPCLTTLGSSLSSPSGCLCGL